MKNKDKTLLKENKNGEILLPSEMKRLLAYAAKVIGNQVEPDKCVVCPDKEYCGIYRYSLEEQEDKQ